MRPPGSDAVALFVDRARLVDPHFTLSGETGPVVARLVQRLDGMPLAIELAAARVEALGVTQLLDRLDDRFSLLIGADRLAAARHRSLAAAVDWSYQLLSEAEQRIFRQVSVFPAPFTLEGAETVAGVAAGAVALRLVDCSLLAAPLAGSDGRHRYLMLDTLRAYGTDRLADSGSFAGAAAARSPGTLCRWPSGRPPDCGPVPGNGTPRAGWTPRTPAPARPWPGRLSTSLATALRLVIALSPWWKLRGNLGTGYALLRAAAGHAAPVSDAWCAVRYWLGQAAHAAGDFAGAVEYYTAVRDAVADWEPPSVLVDALAGRSVALVNINRVGDGIEDARRAVALARDMGYLAGEALASQNLSLGLYYAGDLDDALAWARQAMRIDQAAIPGWIARRGTDFLVLALLESGDVTAAWQHGADGLAQAQRAGDLRGQASFLGLMAIMDQRAGRIAVGGCALRESSSPPDGGPALPA